MRYVLNVESFENWVIDKKNGFEYLGITDRKRRFFEHLSLDDLLLTYVKRKGFLDIRQISSPDVGKLGIRSPYPDGIFPWRIGTKLVAALDDEMAISPNDLKHTKLCDGHWRYRFQNSGRFIDENDGRTIEKAIKMAVTKHLRTPGRIL